MTLGHYCAVLSLAFTICGCGGGTSGTGGGFDSGFAKTSTLNSIAPSDAQKLCEKTVSYLADVFSPDTICPVVAVEMALSPDSGVSQDAASCNAAIDECKNSTEIQQLLSTATISCSDQSSADTFSHKSAMCSAEVGLYEGCIDDIFGAVEDLFSKASCDNVDPNYLTSFNAFFNSPIPPGASCKKLYTLCPGLARDSTKRFAISKQFE